MPVHDIGRKVPAKLQGQREKVRTDEVEKIMAKMQAFKDREREDVRWRSVTAYAKDANLVAMVGEMREIVFGCRTLADMNLMGPDSFFTQGPYDIYRRGA